MDCGLDITRRRLALLAQMVRKFRIIQQNTPEGEAEAARAGEKLREASLTLASSAATLLGDRTLAEIPLQVYQQAVGSSRALPLLELIAAEIRSCTKRTTGGAPPVTPERAVAWDELHCSARQWDRELTTANEELTKALARKTRDAPADFGSEKDALEDKTEGLGGGEMRGDAEGGGDERRVTGDQSIARHFERWVKRILGQEGHALVAAAGERIRVLAVGDRIVLRNITVYHVRDYLQRLKFSALYPFIASVMRCVSGVAPPNLSQTTIDRASALFTEVIEVRSSILKLVSGVNSYTYFIYKIFESIIPPEETDHRRILYYIHLQKPDTLEDHDREWERVCRFIPVLRANTPTSRRNCTRYAPPALTKK